MNDYHISQVRLRELICARCRNSLHKGSYCLFTPHTYSKYCLNCLDEVMKEQITWYKQKIVERRKIIAKVKRNKEKWTKHNIACSVCSQW